MAQIENYDHCLRFQVLDKRISLIDSDAAEVVADNHGNICIHIDFDEQWDGVGKTVRYIYNGMWKDVVLNVDNECICPCEVIKKGRFSLGVYGADLKTSTPIVVTVLESILSMSGEELPEDPTPGQYEQIMKLYADATIAADEATKAAWDAVSAANDSITALNVAKTELEEGGFVNTIKEKNVGAKISVWVGTTDEYEALPTKPNNCLCLLTDDTAFLGLVNTVNALSREVDEISDAVSDNEAEINVLKNKASVVIFDDKENPLPSSYGGEGSILENWQLALDSKIIAASFGVYEEGTVYVPDMLLYEDSVTYHESSPEIMHKSFVGVTALITADPETFKFVTMRIFVKLEIDWGGLMVAGQVSAIKEDGSSPDVFDSRICKLIRIC